MRGVVGEISDLSIEVVVVGLRMKGATGVHGTVVAIDEFDGGFRWIRWDNDKQEFSGFYRNECECEVVQ